MKKFLTYPLFAVLFLSFICVMGFGSILIYHYDGGKKYQFLQKTVLLISAVPKNFKKIIENKSFNLNKLQSLTKHKDKKRFEQFTDIQRNALLVLPRYEHSLSRSVIDIIDLNNFKVIHTYKHDINEMNNQIINIKKFPRIKIDKSETRFNYQHPLLLEDGSIISLFGPAFKIDFCSNLQWINEEEMFHHSIMLDHEKNIWFGGRIKPPTNYIKKYSIENYIDDSIIKTNIDGKILLNKSITEILIQNNIVFDNFALTSSLSGDKDPIHLNDIEPTFSDTAYWKKGDIFLSLRGQSAIVIYRPSNNKIINYITGPFAMQHDIDIISDKEISIFNNNNFYTNNKHSEVLIYNFETKTFKKLFNNQLKESNFKTKTGGLSHIFKDGSLLVEETNHGRILLFNNKGQKEWEFVNKDKNDDIGIVSWIRVIEDNQFIEKFKSLVNNKKCLN